MKLHEGKGKNYRWLRIDEKMRPGDRRLYIGFRIESKPIRHWEIGFNYNQLGWFGAVRRKKKL